MFPKGRWNRRTRKGSSRPRTRSWPPGLYGSSVKAKHTVQNFEKETKEVASDHLWEEQWQEATLCKSQRWHRIWILLSLWKLEGFSFNSSLTVPGSRAAEVMRVTFTHSGASVSFTLRQEDSLWCKGPTALHCSLDSPWTTLSPRFPRWTHSWPCDPFCPSDEQDPRVCSVFPLARPLRAISSRGVCREQLSSRRPHYDFSLPQLPVYFLRHP